MAERLLTWILRLLGVDDDAPTKWDDGSPRYKLTLPDRFVHEDVRNLRREK